MVIRGVVRWLTTLLLLFSFSARPALAAAQGGGALVQYEGTLKLSGAPAPAGSLIRVVALRTWPDMTNCGQAQTDAQGHFTLPVIRRECITADMSHQPIDHYFLVNGENVGHYEGSVWLNLPNTLGRVTRVDLNGTALPASHANSSAAIVLARYIGTLRLGRTPAAPGTAVIVSTAPTGSAAVTCGNGQVVDDLGLYVVDVLEPRCITPDRNLHPIDHAFVVNDQQVGQYEGSVWLNLPNTLGHVVRVDLNGASLPTGDTFSGGPPPQPPTPVAQPGAPPDPGTTQPPTNSDCPPGRLCGSVSENVGPAAPDSPQTAAVCGLSAAACARVLLGAGALGSETGLAAELLPGPGTLAGGALLVGSCVLTGVGLCVLHQEGEDREGAVQTELPLTIAELLTPTSPATPPDPDQDPNLDGQSSDLLPGGGLAAHEGRQQGLGHLLEEHVGKTDQELLKRIADNPGLKGASSFTNRAIAEQVATRTLADPANQALLKAWLSNPSNLPPLVLNYTGLRGVALGRGVLQGATSVQEMENATLVLKKTLDPLTKAWIPTAGPVGEGWFTLTGYPVP